MPASHDASVPSALRLSSGFSRQQWGLLLLLAAINFTHILDFVTVMPLGDSLRQQLQINPRQFGMVVSAYGLASMITGILSSSVVDLYDRKTILVGSFGGFTLATFYCGFAPNYSQLLIARCLAGLFGGTFLIVPYNTQFYWLGHGSLWRKTDVSYLCRWCSRDDTGYYQSSKRFFVGCDGCY